MLSINSIYKTYEKQPLLNGVSFEVKQGETVCLLGRSGSGKSTILRIIAGIEKPESGEVLWKSENLENVPVHKRNFGFMFQDYALFPHKNVYDNVAFGLRMKDSPEDETREKVINILQKVKLEKFQHREVADLSGGEQQRVALARALAPEPRLLMLDEPLGALDRTLREQLMIELRVLLHETQIPAIYVTHDQEEAFTIGDRLILLNEGRIVQNSAPQDIFLNPANSWVAQFLGLTNIVDGEILSINPLIVRTDFGEMIVEGQSPENLVVGKIVEILIRPEGLLVLNSNGNGFSAKIIDDVFLGQNWKVKIQIGSHEFTFIVDEPLPTGTIIQVTFSPEAVGILGDSL